MSSVYRRLIAAVGTVVLLVVGIQLFNTSSASAHANMVNGSSVCQSDGTYTVTWTVANDYNLTDVVKVTGFTPSSASVSPMTLNLAKLGSGLVYATKIPGNATSASLTVNGTWSDQYSQSDSGSVTLDGKCLPGKQPTAPTWKDGACVNYAVNSPTITIPSDAGVSYTIDSVSKAAGTYPVSGGAHTIVASSTVYTLTGTTTWTPTLTAVSGDCLTVVTPVNPTVTQAACVSGSHTPTNPTVTPATTDGITYSVSPKGPYSGGQSVTVTATLNQGSKWGTLPNGWTKNNDGTASYTVTFNASPDCTEKVSPANPTVTQAVCQNGSHTPTNPTIAPATTDGITYTVSPKGPYSGGQTVTVTATLQDGYKWGTLPGNWTKVSDTVATDSVTFDAAPDCRETVSPTNPKVTDSVCQAGSHTATNPTLTTVDTDGVKYTVSTGTYTAGQTVTVTAHLQDGYKWGDLGDWTIGTDASTATLDVTFPNAPDCREVVSPVSPDVTQSVCDGHFPTTPTATPPADTASISYTINPEGPYTTASAPLVTATAADGYKFAAQGDLPAGWTRVDDTTATYTVAFTAAPECRADTTPVNPTVTEAVCAATGTTPVAPTLTTVDTDEVSYVASPKDGWTAGSTATVTATTAPGYKFADVLPDGWTRVSDTEATYEVSFAAAPTCVVPVNPDLTQSACAASGTTPVAPTLTLPSTTGVSYSTDSAAPYAGGQTVIVTATADSGYQFDSGTLPGWTIVSDTVETYAVTFDASPSCAETATPTFSDDECRSFVPTTATYTIPDTKGVDYYVDTVLTAPGTYTATDGSTISVVAKPQTGYTLVGTTSWSHEFSVTPTCTQSQQAAKASFAVQQCVSGKTLKPGSYTVPTSTGVDYLVNGAVVKAGTYSAKPGTTVTVVAQAKPGYTLSGTSRWSFTYGAAKQCSNVDSASVTRPPSHSDSAETASRGPLASTGVHSSSLLSIGAGLLVLGVVITLLAGVTRRRRTDGPRH